MSLETPNQPGFKFSHFGMFVTDIAKVADFYTRLLDFTVTDRGQLPGPNGMMDLVFLSRDPDEHHQIVLLTGRPNDMPFNPINQISLKTDSLDTLCEMHETLLAEKLPNITPVTHGNALSIYVPDPEGNRLELYFDLPWYVSQPMRVAIDLNDRSTLMQRLESHARTLPGFRPRSVWRAEMAQRMGVK
ncbi:VOC family protein [Pandoraea communis]|uniref:Biphenyl-2,3-diol 1,2-dioxygenase 2 n=1 Tax=Pandoraea communis TaxID=2508297 RepID=A0A5E4VLF5_9BURK|nr:VOC family protein [Pandoraea communis]MDM8357526.1 VOC family protein [Pandoraea communis]VVE12723.1 Biphenyl-2,3-diol 1,2-dioxygenase 2 [Pandoraea communis]